MKNRYLFRGKTIDNGDFIVGNLLTDKSPIEESKKSYIYIPSNKIFISEPEKVEVDPVTIGQCTGIKDKNGNLIFEGDIIETVYRCKICVYWAEYGYTTKGCINGTWYPDALSRNLEIIGNIHDNPELLVLP